MDEEHSNEVTITFTDTSEVDADITKLYLNPKFSDIILVVDGQKLHAHKNILSVRCKHFETLFCGESKDALKNEVIVDEVSYEIFLHLLKYIYTGSITISSDVELALKVLTLAHKYSMKGLKLGLIAELKSNFSLQNICCILNIATLYDLAELQDACHSFMDSNALEILSSGCLDHLTQKSMINLLKRDAFVAPEIEIFKSVAKWCEKNYDFEDQVIQCVRLSSLKATEIMSTVWPSKLVSHENLLRAIAEALGLEPKTSQPRVALLVDENIATRSHGAQVISNVNSSDLLTGKRDNKSGVIYIVERSGLVVKLGAPSYLNHIQLMLWEDDLRDYSYSIEISLDQKKWKRVIDYSHYVCRSLQNLYFEQQIVQYIKILGIFNTNCFGLHIMYVEAYFKSNIPTLVDGIIRPDSNVATLEKKARVIEGTNPRFLLNGDTVNYESYIGFTFHDMDDVEDSIVVQLAQPFMISSMKLLLWDRDDRTYKYYIETSVDEKEWEMAVDRRDEECESWQHLRFEERAVVFIKIHGTHNTANNGFHCVHLECPAQDD